MKKYIAPAFIVVDIHTEAVLMLSVPTTGENVDNTDKSERREMWEDDWM